MKGAVVGVGPSSEVHVEWQDSRRWDNSRAFFLRAFSGIVSVKVYEKLVGEKVRA